MKPSTRTRAIRGFSDETIMRMLIEVIRDAADPEPVKDHVTKEENLEQASLFVNEIWRRLREGERAKQRLQYLTGKG